MNRVEEYEGKIKEILASRLADADIRQVFWEPGSGRLVFGLEGRMGSRCFKIQVLEEDMAAALGERGVTRDRWEQYLARLADSLGLPYGNLECPAPFALFGLMDDGCLMGPYAFCDFEDHMPPEYFMWLMDMAANQDFLDELAGKILNM